MVLGGPITFTPDDLNALFTSAMVLVTVSAAVSGGIIAAAVRWSAGGRAAAFAAGRAALVITVLGLLVGVVGSAAIRSQPSAESASVPTTSFVPAQRADDPLAFTGDEAAAERLREQLEQTLAPLAATGAEPTPAEVVAALGTVLGPAGSRQQETRPGGAGGMTFVVEAAGGCVTGSVGIGVVDVQVGGYLRDGGCIAAVGH